MKNLTTVFLLSWLFLVDLVASEIRPEDEAMEKVLECASMPPERKISAMIVVEDLQRVLQERWPGSKVILFGSMLVDIATKNSDVDCYVWLPEDSQSSNQTLSEAADLLKKYPHLFHNVETFLNSIASITHFTHIPTGHKGDINFRSSRERMQSYILKHMLQSDVRTRQLVILIKYWAHLHMPQLKMIMSNFGFVNLAIFYLQQIKALPSIATLQKENEEWDVSKIDGSNNYSIFNDIPYHLSNDLTIYDILGGFFKFYGDFDFENKVVSTFSGTAIDRKKFEDLNTVPDIFKTYKSRVGEDVTESLNITTPICIQSLILHGHNEAAATTKEQLDYFRSNLNYAAKTMKDLRQNSLQSIFNDIECFRYNESINDLHNY